MSAAATPVCSSQKAKKAQKVKKDVFAEADDSELWEIVDRFSHDFGFTQTTKAKKASSESSASSAIAVPVTPPRPLTKLEIIKRALDIDNEHRYKGVTGDLIPFSDVKIAYADKSWEWDDSVPVVHTRHPAKAAADWITTLDDFKEEINANHPWLEGIVSRNLVAAGGAPVSTIQRAYINDVDLFLVGLSESKCDDKINEVIETLSKAWGVLTVYRTASCITIRAGQLTGSSGTSGHPLVQIILRRYDTISEVIHGFDNGACSVAYDGNQVWFTSVSRVAFELLVMVPDMTRRRNSYERRLCKYFGRGFGLVLPEIDIEKVRSAHRKAEAVELRKLQFDVRTIDGKHIIVDNIDTVFEWREDPDAPAAESNIGYTYGIYNRAKKVADEEADEESNEETDEESNKETDEKTDKEAEKEDASSEYGTIPYNDMRRISVRNFKAVQCLPVRTKSLCGWTVLPAEGLEDFDFKAIAPRFDGFEHEISRHARIQSINLVALENLLGKNMAAAIIRNVLDRKLINFEQLVKKLLEVIGSRAVIPFEYLEVSDATGLIGPFTMASMSYSEWYGEFFKAA